MKKLVLLGVLLFLLFVFFSFLVAKNVFVNTDFNFTVKLQDLIGNRLITFLSLFSIIGRVEFASVILLIALFIKNKLNKIYVLFFYVMTGVFEDLGKFIVNQSGPPIRFLKTDLSIRLPSDYIPHDFNAYPSGHLARTTFISGILLFIIWTNPKMSKNMKLTAVILVVIFNLLMFISRIYLGEHWLSDVIGGALLGFSLAIFASNINFRKLFS